MAKFQKIVVDVFGESRDARLVAKFCENDNVNEVVYCRNPYGTHNLMFAVNGATIRHGNMATLSLVEAVANCYNAKKFLKKVRHFLGKQMVKRDHVRESQR